LASVRNSWLAGRSKFSLVSLVFRCYQQVYDIFNMSCLGVILQVRGCDGMSTPQNGAAAHLQSHVSCICQGGFPLPFLQFSSSRVSFCCCRSSLKAKFHYAIWFEAGRRPASNQLRTGCEVRTNLRNGIWL